MRPPPRLEVPIDPRKFQGPVPPHLLGNAARRKADPEEGFRRRRAELHREAEALLAVRGHNGKGDASESAPPDEPGRGLGWTGIIFDEYATITASSPGETSTAPAAPVPEAHTTGPAPVLTEASRERGRHAAAARWQAFDEAIRQREPEVVALLAAGYSVAETMRKTGLSRRIVKKLVGGRVFLCVCGLAADHRGPCAPPHLDTPEHQRARERARERSATDEARHAASVRARRNQQAKPAEERSRAAREGHARRTPEQRTAIARRGALARVKLRRERRAAARSDLAAGKRLEAPLDRGGVLTCQVSGAEGPLTSGEEKLLAELAVLFDRFNRRRRAT